MVPPAQGTFKKYFNKRNVLLRRRRKRHSTHRAATKRRKRNHHAAAQKGETHNKETKTNKKAAGESCNSAAVATMGWWRRYCKALHKQGTRKQRSGFFICSEHSDASSCGVVVSAPIQPTNNYSTNTNWNTTDTSDDAIDTSTTT